MTKLRDSKCLLCEHPLYLFIYGEKDMIGDCYCISCEDNSLCCKNCNTYYLLCKNCSDKDYIVIKEGEYVPNYDASIVLCQFLGHQYDDTREEDFDDSIFDYTYIDNRFEHKNIYYAHVDDLKNLGPKCLITGPDGGFDHYWRCNKCNTTYKETDK